MRLLFVVLSLAFVWGGCPLPALGLVVDHRAVALYTALPSFAMQTVRQRLSIYYNHTSHGSQLVTGLGMLASEGAALPDLDDHYETDLGNENWPSITRDYLDTHTDTAVVMWSWCGQLSWYDSAAVQAYLDSMEALEAQYPQVRFVYMTGHLDGTGPSGTLATNNAAIRAHCREKGKILFDFADIETCAPDGRCYAEGSDSCEWCQNWCATHTCPTCSDCAHSHCFNCYRKGQALWVLLSRLTGWNPTGAGHLLLLSDPAP